MMVRLLTSAVLVAGCGGARDAASWTVTLAPDSTVIRSTSDYDLVPRSPAFTSDGRIVALLDGIGGPSVGVFDADGTLLGRFGRTGSGPGEFREPNGVGVGTGDTIWVMESRARTHVFTPFPDTTFVRTLTTPRESSLRLSPRGLVSTESFRTGDGKAAIMPPRVFDGDGTMREELRSPWFDPEAQEPSTLVDVGRDITWYYRRSRFRLEGIRLDGTRAHVVTREVDWYDGVEEGKPRKVDDKPLPLLSGIAPEGDSLLWVHVRRPGAQWTPFARPAGGRPQPMVEASRLMAMPSDEEWETEIDLFDLSCGVLRATLDLPGSVHGFVAPRVLWSWRLAGDSVPELVITRLAIDGVERRDCS